MDRSAETYRLAYRAFVVNDQGRLGGVPKVIEADDDLDAARKAEPLAERNAVELWEGARLVVRLTPGFRNGQNGMSDGLCRDRGEALRNG